MYYSQYKAENKVAAVLIHLVSRAARGWAGFNDGFLPALEKEMATHSSTLA